uniref:Uncharacterized protein n=1 Tax=Cucumis melo TaxID=3656 RepID=A0A9I9E6A2_CUCME
MVFCSNSIDSLVHSRVVDDNEKRRKVEIKNVGRTKAVLRQEEENHRKVMAVIIAFSRKFKHPFPLPTASMVMIDVNLAYPDDDFADTQSNFCGLEIDHHLILFNGEENSYWDLFHMGPVGWV